MDKIKFFERYKNVFNTNDFKSTYAAYKALPIEEQQRLKRDALSKSMKSLDASVNEKRSASLKKNWANKTKEEIEERNSKISSSLKQYYENDENKIKHSRAIKQAYRDGKISDEKYKKQSESLNLFYKNHPEAKEKIAISVSKYQKEHKEELRQKTKDAMALYFATEEGQENLRNWAKASRAGGSSKAEKELQQMILSIAPDAVFNDRSILNGKELDIYVPSKKVAIEYNGNIWHSEAYKKDLAKDCHLQKTLACEEKGIRLIHIFSDELESKKSIVESIIKSSLGVYDKKYFARKLQVKEISHKEAKQFFEANHINGHVNGYKYFALVDNEKIVQAISIGKSRFKKNETELLRMATLLNAQVVGGFSKLLKHCNENEMTSYLDRRMFNGSGYLSSGWQLVKSTSPSYFYTKGNERFNRMLYMKSKCLKMWPDADPNKTEHQLCLEHGLYRIYDCGTLVFHFFNN